MAERNYFEDILEKYDKKGTMTFIVSINKTRDKYVLGLTGSAGIYVKKGGKVTLKSPFKGTYATGKPNSVEGYPSNKLPGMIEISSGGTSYYVTDEFIYPEDVYKRSMNRRAANTQAKSNSRKVDDANKRVSSKYGNITIIGTGARLYSRMPKVEYEKAGLNITSANTELGRQMVKKSIATGVSKSSTSGEHFVHFKSKDGKYDFWVSRSQCSIPNVNKLEEKKKKKKKKKGDVGSFGSGEIDSFTPQGPGAENEESAKDVTITKQRRSDYTALLRRHQYAFGSPPGFDLYTDPIHDTDRVSKDIRSGRSVEQMWYSNPSMLSIVPGTVDYLPGFSSKDKGAFFERVRGFFKDAAGDAADADNENSLNGKLYSFKSDYADYIDRVNLVARVTAEMLGIGNDKYIMGGSKPLNRYDYAYYTTPYGKDATVSIGNKVRNALKGGLFNLTRAELTTAINDNVYVNFFVNTQNGVNANDGFSNSTGDSFFEGLLGSGSQISQMAQNIQFLFGGAISDGAKADIENIVNSTKNANEMLYSMTDIAKRYASGGRLIFPKMVTGMDYEKSISCELDFISPYGDRRSIFKYVLLPAIHLLVLMAPKQVTGNMYTYPYILRVFNQGNTNTDLSVMTGLELTRGGDNDTSWTVDGLSTHIKARFTITPLYTNMMVSSSRNPFMFLHNTALMEYLGTMCGMDLKTNTLSDKVRIAENVIKNWALGTPTSYARRFNDLRITNKLRNFLNIVN